MVIKKSTEEKIQVKQFKSGSSDFWWNNAHYHLNKLGEVIFVCGGISSEEGLEAVRSFVKRNKKGYKKAEPLIFAQEGKEWMKLTFGKHSGQTLDVIKDIEPSYLKWLIQNTNDSKIKAEIKELLNLK